MESIRVHVASTEGRKLAEQRDVELAALLGLTGYRPQPRIQTALVDDKYYALSVAHARETIAL